MISIYNPQNKERWEEVVMPVTNGQLNGLLYKRCLLYTSPRDEGVAPTSFINNRARLSMDYKRSDLELKMSAQHVGVWGQRIILMNWVAQFG